MPATDLREQIRDLQAELELLRAQVARYQDVLQLIAAGAYENGAPVPGTNAEAAHEALTAP